jgi:monolysocardiolipin acyltransferase
MEPAEQPAAPSGLWRNASLFVTGTVGVLCRGFLKGLNKSESPGLDKFLELLEERKDVEGRERGLITGMPPKYHSWKVN